MLLTTLMCFGTPAKAAAVCKTMAQKSSKACARTVHKKPAPSVKSASTSTTVATAPPAPVAVASEATNPVPTTPCFAALAASQASQHMAAKVPFFIGLAPGPEVLANASHPSKREHEELSSLIAGYQMCQEMSAPALEGAETGPQPRLDWEQWRASRSILEALRAGKLTYGAAAGALAEAGQRN
jgi:hypothetical protein